jgi:ferredoxin-NADP reductase
VRLAAESRGGSRQLCTQLQESEHLWISAPRNLFAMHAGSRQVLIAGGIGITPLLAMAEELEARGEAFVLHYYVHHRQQIAFAERWQRGFRYGRLLLHAGDAGESARTHVPREIRAATSHEHLYLCGPNAFMQHFDAMAAGFGWRPAQIHQEHFAVAVPLADSDEPFEVELARSGRVVTVPARSSIAGHCAAVA